MAARDASFEMRGDSAPMAAPMAPAIAEANRDNGDAPPAPEPSPGSGGIVAANDAKGQVLSSAQSPIIIYTGSIELLVFELAAGVRRVEELTREVGGFVSHRTERSITVRIPAARFTDAVGKVEKVGEVRNRELSAQDVTEEYLDVEVRLRNARAMRDRFEQLLAKATSVQDSLAIEKELNRVASEIERLEGRLRYLRDRAALSTLTVNFYEKSSDAPSPSNVRLPFPWLDTLGLGRLLQL